MKARKKHSYKYYLEMMFEDGVLIEEVPKEYLDEDMYLAYLEPDPERIGRIPENIKTDSFYLKALTDCPCIIEQLSPEFADHLFCLHTLNKIKDLSLEQMLTHKSGSIRELGQHILNITSIANKA